MSLGGGQVAVLSLHAASAGYATKAAYSFLRRVYVPHSTKHVRAPRKRPNFGERRACEVRRNYLPSTPLKRTRVGAGPLEQTHSARVISPAGLRKPPATYLLTSSAPFGWRALLCGARSPILIERIVQGVLISLCRFI